MNKETAPIRVTLITDRAKSGTGPNRRVTGCLNAMTSQPELEVTLVANELDPDEPFSSKLANKYMGYNPHSWLSMIKNLFIIWKATRHSDIIYVSNGLRNFLYGWLFRRRRRKFVAGPSIAPIPILCPPYDPNRLMTVSMVDTWIEQSEIRAQYAMSGGAKRDEFVVLRNCLDLTKFSPAQRDPAIWQHFGLDSSRPKIVFSARILDRPNQAHANRKGTHILLEAFERLIPSYPDWDLILVGEPSERYIEKYKDVPSIHFIGLLDDNNLPTVYASSDIGCITSLYEGSGWAGTEMFAIGLPLVSSKVGIMPELIENNVSGILFDLFPHHGQEPYPDACDRLINALIPLLESKELRENLGKNARTQATQKLSCEVFGEQLLMVFQAVLRGERTPWPQDRAVESD